jgi:hypothetical protein
MILLGFMGEVHCEFENRPPRGEVAGNGWQERFQVEGYRFQLAVPLLPPEGAFQRLPKASEAGGGAGFSEQKKTIFFSREYPTFTYIRLH